MGSETSIFIASNIMTKYLTTGDGDEHFSTTHESQADPMNGLKLLVPVDIAQKCNCTVRNH